MDIAEKDGKEEDYSTDSNICADEVKKGRPFPYIIFQNMIALDVFPPSQIVKVGDTVSVIEEGKNAGVWSIGVINGSSELGLTEAEVRQLDTRKYKQLASKVAKKFNEAGADFVIDSIDELPQIIDVVGR